MGKLIGISICADDIDKTKAEKSEKNGKTYYSFTVDVSDNVNDWGKDVAVYHSQSKEERDAKTPRKFVGQGNVFWSSDGITSKTKQGRTQEQAPVDNASGDMPF